MNKIYTLILSLIFIGIAQQGYSQVNVTMCAGSSITTSTTGNLYDSGGPSGYYANNVRCSFLIEPTCADSITLSFASFILESCCDYVSVYDGTSTAGTLIYTRNGSSLPVDAVATSGAMYVVFSTDGSVTYAGFAASWTTVTTGGIPPAPTMVDTISTCNSTATVTAVGTYSSYLWNTGDTTASITATSSGNYTVSVTDTGTCVNVGESYVNLMQPQINSGDTTVCAGYPLDLNAQGACLSGIVLEYTNSKTVTINTTAGDDRSGIAITKDYIYYVGDNNTVRYDVDLNTSATYPIRDGIFSDLASGQLYSFWNSSYTAFSTSSNYLSGINSLRKMNSTLGFTGSHVALSQTINAGYGSMIFASEGYVVLWANSNKHFYKIDLPSGIVTDIGIYDIGLSMYNGENWSSWGVAECDGAGYNFLLRTVNNTSTGTSTNQIMRFDLQAQTYTNATTIASNSLGDINCITYSPWENRWYFASEFYTFAYGTNVEHLGYSDARISLSGPSINNYTWSTAATTQSITVTPTSTTNYSVTVSKGAVTCSDTITVTTTTSPSFTLADTLALCNQDSVQLSISSTYSSYEWSNSATTQNTYVESSGLYYATVTNASSCETTDSIYVNLLDARIHQGDTTLCTADSIRLSVGAITCGLQIQSLTQDNKVNVNNPNGGQRGGIAVTPNYVYSTGATATTRFDLNLGNLVVLPQRAGIFSDAGTGELYTFWNTSHTNFTTSSSNNINAIRRLDASLNYGSTINLSQAINAGSGSAVFAGTGYVIIWSNNSDTFYKITLSNGYVEVLGTYNVGSDIYNAGGWAAWGIAECGDSGESLLIHTYRNLGYGTYRSIGRFDLNTNTWSNAVGSLNFYSGIESIIYSKWNDRWYYSHEYSYTGLGQYSNNILYSDASASNIANSVSGFGDYAWSTNDTNSNIVVNPSTNTDYSLTVTNGSLACSDTVTISVIQSPTVSDTANPLTCFGDTNSTATLTVTGGTTPYVYNWSTGATTSSITNLVAGNYEYTVTGANNCEIKDSIRVVTPLEIVSTATINNAASCYGYSNGSATVSVVGGTPGYTYLWPSGETDSTDTQVTGGINVITITDASSCAILDTILVTSATKIDSAGPVTSTTTFYCPGTAGSLVAANGNVGVVSGYYNQSSLTQSPSPTKSSDMDFTFSSMPKNANGTMIVDIIFKGELSSSSRYLTVYDENGNYIGRTRWYYSSCSTARSMRLYFSSSYYNNWLADGRITFRLTPYGYSSSYCDIEASINVAYNYTQDVTNYWFEGAMSSDTTQSVGRGANLAITPQTTTTFYTANFAGDCHSQVDSITVIVPPAPNTTYIMNPTGLCPGETTSISAYGAYTYVWPAGDSTISGSGSTATVTAWTTTDYLVTITNAFNCVYVDTMHIPIYDAPVGNILTTTNASCGSAADGQAVVYATGGTSPYVYSWSNGNSGALQLSLNAGNYVVTISDGNSCLDSLDVTVGGPIPIAFNETLSNISCNGQNDGSIALATSGGNSPYTYAWSNGNGTSSISGLSPGNYSVTITDNTSCSHDTTFVISEPMALLASITGTTPETCAGLSNGSITSIAAGGTAPYSFVWDNGGTTAGLTGLVGGPYSLTVTDANGCTSVTSGTVITTPTTLALNAGNVSDVLCFNGNDGTADATATGGVLPYSYSWSNGDATSNLSNATAGIYSVTVTDANSCQEITSVTITEPTQLVVTNSVVTNVTCFGLTDASATVSVSGGVSAYSYLWPDNSVLSANVNLGSGTSVVTVTDANNCTETTSIVVTEPSVIDIVPTVTNISCNGLTDGEITTAVTGGSGSYSYNWSTSATSQSISGLATGNYSVTVTDVNNCVVDSSFTITQPITMTASIGSSTNIACKGSATGDASAAVAGGTTPYSYAWSNSATSRLNANLVAAAYIVTVTDANGCNDTSMVTLTEPATLLTVSLTDTVNVLCNSGSNGSVRAVATNGGTTYSYAWSNGSSNATISNLSAGSYTVSVSDNYGCIITDAVTITEPSSLTLFLGAKSDVTCFGASNGSASIFVSGGTSAYTYAWSNSSASSSISSVGPGMYTFTVTDANSCQDSATVTITEPTALTATISNLQNVACNGSATGFAVVDGAGGTAPYSYVWSTGATTDSIYNKASGFYGVTITDGNGCIDSALANLTQPTSMVVSLASSTNNVCYGDALGQGQVSVSGGAIPYVYAWPSGATTVAATNLTAGNHVVTVTDNNNCQDTTLVTITEPSQLVTSISSQMDVLCNGVQNGSVGINVSGGTVSYTYLWSNGDSDTLLNNVGAGIFTVTVTDNNNCLDSLTVTVTEPTQLNSSLTVTNADCNADTNGAISSTISGGTLPYQYSWSTSSTTANIANLGANTYYLTITDANGCLDTLSATVTEPMVLANSLTTAGNVNCNGSSDGAATTSTSGGTLPYSFAWSGGQTVESPINLSSGMNTLTITDANGCIDSTTVTISTTSNLSLSLVSVSDILCNGDSTANIMVSAAGGIGTSVYSWSVIGSGSTLSNQPAGTYDAYVTDSLNCMDTLVVTITDPAAITPFSLSHQNPLCNGDANGRVEVSSTGGVGMHTYLWPNGNTTSIDSTLVAGVYTVTITDSNSCVINYDVYLADPAILVNPAFVTNNVTCASDMVGRVTMSPRGGSRPYSYNWSNGGTGNIITNLRAGDYIITLTDANGCQLMDTATITSRFVETLSQLPSDTSVCGGILTLTANAAFTSYNWSTGASGASVIISQSGLITFSGVDGNGCTTYDTLQVNILPAINFDLGADVNTICEGTNYVIDAGSGYVSYTWSTGDTTSTTTVSTSGTYSVEIVDTSSCHATDQVNMNMLALPVVDLGADTVGCTEKGVNTISLDAGVGFTSYLWSTGATSQLEDVTIGGDYSVVVENADGCKNSDTINVTFDICSGINDPVTSLSISMYPNPTQGDLTIDLKGFLGQTVEIEILSTDGHLIRQVRLESNNQSELQTQIDLNDVAQGLYFVVVKSGDEVKVERITIY